jgi:hypothetical protein
MSVKFSREMQLKREEFLRELPKAIGYLEHQVSGNRVTVKDGDRRVEIALTDEGERHLGSLDLPMERIDFEFIGYTQEEIDAFMERFDQHTLRAGGP